ncbi:MAG: hypothetical protein K2N43_04790 [Lachnospiraceae bacterium]|nr:hypothetical protein [Lachnospiraceae bacterium]
MKNFLENYDLLFAMTILTAVAILIKCICAIVYQILLRDAEQIGSTKNKWMRTMHTKFEACYKLRVPIHNPSCFIKNYMEQYHVLGCSLKTLENTDVFCGLIVAGGTLLGIMCGTYYELPARWIFIHSMTLAFFLLFLAVSEIIFQVRHKRNFLHIRLLNYFENTLQGKLEKQYLHPEETKAYQNSYFDKEENDEKTEESKDTKKDDDAIQDITIEQEEAYASTISPDMQELIDSLLEESKINKELDRKKDKLKAAVANEKYRLVEEIIKEYL